MIEINSTANGFGSKSWSEVQKDKHQFHYDPSFPVNSSARSTFYAEDADNEQKFNRLWKLQHGRGHTYEGWDGQRERLRIETKYRRARAILSQAEVVAHLRKPVANRVVQENLTGFSRYYQGLDGATIGFAALYQCDTKTEAKESYLVEKASEFLEIDCEQLIDYVWRTYAGETK